MNFWKNLKAGANQRLEDVADAYGSFSGWDRGGRSALQAPENPGISRDVRDYMEQMRLAAGKEYGEGYQDTDYYKSMISDVEQQGRKMGWNTGSQHASAGTLGSGAGRRAATERGQVQQRARLAAAVQAQQATARDQAIKYDQLLRSAGFAQGVHGADFERDFRVFLAKKGLRDDEINREMQKMQMWLGLAGSVVGVGATIATGGAAAPLWAGWEASQRLRDLK